MIQLDHSVYKVPGSVQNLKALTFIESSTSMCGAVIVPDVSANQVGIKALKQFIMVNGFTHSVLQCDGHSGLMKLQDQVGKDLSLPTQISPPYSRQSQGAVERFRKNLYGQVRAIKLGLAAHLGIHPDSTAARLMSWIVQHAVFTINRYLARQDGKTSRAGVQQGSFKSFGSFRGKSSGPCSSHPSLPKASFESSASEAIRIVVGKMCHHWGRTLWLMRVRFSKLGQSPV